MCEDKCLRCGKCCYYPYAGKMKKCQYLEYLDDGTTKCSVYDKRLTIIIDVTPEGHPVKCLTRAQQKRYILGCPYSKTVWLRNRGK